MIDNIQLYYNLKAQEQQEIVHHLITILRIKKPLEETKEKWLDMMDQTGRELLLGYYPKANFPKERGYTALFSYAHSEMAYLYLANERFLREYTLKIYKNFGLSYDPKLEKALKEAYLLPTEHLVMYELSRLSPKTLEQTIKSLAQQRNFL